MINPITSRKVDSEANTLRCLIAKLIFWINYSLGIQFSAVTLFSAASEGFCADAVTRLTT